MPESTDSPPARARRPAARLLQAGLLTALSDGIFATVLSVVVYQSTFARLWQGVASVPLGKDALEGGAPVVWFGLFLHVSVAFTWSALFLFVVLRWDWIRRLLASRFGVVRVASFYGPFIWLTMSLVVIPLLLHRPPSITARWWIQLIGHIPFVALPMVASLAPPRRR